MSTNAETLSEALRTEAEMEAEEDRLSEECRAYIRDQLAALERNDNAGMKRLAREIEQLNLRRRAVRQ